MALFKAHRPWLISVLRLTPALAVAWIPFPTLERALIQSFYRVRGPLAPQSDVRLVRVRLPEEKEWVEKALRSTSAKTCWLLTQKPHSLANCLNIALVDRYTPSDLKQAVDAVADPATSPASNKILFYGPLSALKTYDAMSLFSRPMSPQQATDSLILFDDRDALKIPLNTPLGPLSPLEWALNGLLTHAENRPQRPPPPWARGLFPSLMAAVAAALIYSYPVALSLIFSSLVGGIAYATAYLAFAEQGLHLPLASAWLSMLTALILGLGDRLDRRERREWAVEQEAEAIRTLDEMRNNFLSLVSHDLKTPVAKILALLDRLNREEFGPVPPAQRECLDKIVSASGYLQRTIATLLLLHRIESQDFTIHKVPSDLTNMLTQAIEHHRPLASERRISIDEELDPTFLVDIDPELISQVINNLLENALKYSPQGAQLVVRSGESENCVELSPPQPGIWFEVQDSGPGIAPQDRRYVLEKFMRGSAENTAADQSVKGTGLGLYLAKFFVEKHGGCLTLLSQVVGEKARPGDPAPSYFGEGTSGTVIRVTLPIETPVVTPA